MDGAIVALPAAVVIVPAPSRSNGRIDFENGVDNLNSCQDDGIVRLTNAIPHKLKKAAVYNIAGRKISLLTGRVIGDAQDS